MSVRRYKAIQKFSKDLEGVFTLPDLKVILDEKTDVTLFRAIRQLVDRGEIIKVKRGIYASPDASLETISNRIDPSAYISTGTVLAKNLIIGSIPARKVQAVKTGRPRIFECKLGIIEHLSIAPHLYFGYNPDQGRLIATPEKAFLDCCYFYFKGRRFSFDLSTDINFEDLDMALIEEYLNRYGKQFVSFYKRVIGQTA